MRRPTPKHMETAARVGDAAFFDAFTAVDALRYPTPKWWLEGFAPVQPPDVVEYRSPPRNATLSNQYDRLAHRRGDYSAGELRQRLASELRMPGESRDRARRRAAAWRSQNAREREFEARVSRKGRLSKEAKAWNADPTPEWSVLLVAEAQANTDGGMNMVGQGQQTSPRFVATRAVPRQQIHREYLETARAAVRTNGAKAKGRSLSTVHNYNSESAVIFPTSIVLEMYEFAGATRQWSLFGQDSNDVPDARVS